MLIQALALTLAQTGPNDHVLDARMILALTLVAGAITTAIVSFCNSRTPLAGDEH